MQFEQLWPTVISSGKFEIPGLLDHIFLNYDLNNPPSEIDGYNIFEDQSPVMQQFQNLAYEAFNDYLKETLGRQIGDWQEYELKAWITGHGKNYNMTIHNHSGAQLSGVFYIMAEDPAAGGDIVFSDPRSNANRGYDEWFNPMFKRRHHRPETGDYLIFPSFTYHHVNPYYSTLRVCIPVDLFLYRG
jgi:hypothetical protein